jgi:ABC-type polysaccharide/polyol phosphate transport system ATPase subunit
MSNSDVVIRVDGLGKKYSLHHEQGERYTVLRDVVARQAKAAGRLLNPFTLAGQLLRAQRQAAQEHAASEEEFWALKDVSFEIRRGERVGIIGRNGAGKSTLLKILSRITEPTTGRVEIRGRVASLLEVGTGFHPELTGRENIYLNGAILGMTRREIRAKFDEIVDFAEVEKFLDTPVKRYSSGMYVRLAFAVAAHLEPEILVVDEVLAVGDAKFRKKCLDKMNDISTSEGKTVLLVSHQLEAITTLCERCILLHKASIHKDGETEDAIQAYDDLLFQKKTMLTTAKEENAFIKNVKAEYRRQGNSSLVDEIQISIELDQPIETSRDSIHIGIYNKSKTKIALVVLSKANHISPHASVERVSFRASVTPLTPGVYTLNAAVLDNSRLLYAAEDIGSFLVPIDISEDYPMGDTGVLRMQVKWK